MATTDAVFVVDTNIWLYATKSARGLSLTTQDRSTLAHTLH